MWINNVRSTTSARKQDRYLKYLTFGDPWGLFLLAGTEAMVYHAICIQYKIIIIPLTQLIAYRYSKCPRGD